MWRFSRRQKTLTNASTTFALARKPLGRSSSYSSTFAPTITTTSARCPTTSGRRSLQWRWRRRRCARSATNICWSWSISTMQTPYTTRTLTRGCFPSRLSPTLKRQSRRLAPPASAVAVPPWRSWRRTGAAPPSPPWAFSALAVVRLLFWASLGRAPSTTTRRRQSQPPPPQRPPILLSYACCLPPQRGRAALRRGLAPPPYI